MQFCLRTGFRESSELFGGTDGHPFTGSEQESGWALHRFGALSTIASNAYKRVGGGANIKSAYLARAFLPTAVMYVDNIDLLHWGDCLLTSDEELVENVQRDVLLWGAIVQSTGGMLKSLKHSLFLLTYKWMRGHDCLKTLCGLPDAPYKVVRETSKGEEDRVYPPHVTVPQPNGPDLPIRTHKLKDAVKMIGVYHSPGAKKSGKFRYD